MIVQIFKRTAAKHKKEFTTKNYLNLIKCLEKWLSLRGDKSETRGADTSKLRIAKLHYVTNV